jgi:hypothetical protein
MVVEMNLVTFVHPVVYGPLYTFQKVRSLHWLEMQMY